MLVRPITRSSTFRFKTQRFTRRLSTSSAEYNSADFFRSSSSPTPPPKPAFSQPSDLPPPLSHPTASKFRSFLKFGAFSALFAAICTAGYATYAYTVDEVDKKTKAFRSSAYHPLVDTTPTIENLPHLLYSAVVTVPSKAIDLYMEMRRAIEERMQEIAEPVFEKLLPDMDPQYQGVMTLVLDLRGTLIHSEWKRETGWSTYKRPGLDAFLLHMAQFYEIVIYSDDPVIDDTMIVKFSERGVSNCLARPHTKYMNGKHYRDLSKLNRDPSRIIYVSGHALENCLQQENCVPIKPWKKEADDTTLIDLIPFLEFVGVYKPDIRQVLTSYQGKDIPTEFRERSNRLMQKQNSSSRRRSWI